MKKHLRRIQDVNKIEMMRKVVTELRQAGRKLIPVEIGLRQVEIEVVSEQTTIEKGSARVEMELKRVQSRPTSRGVVVTATDTLG